MSATDIAAYTYRAELLCPPCTLSRLCGGIDVTAIADPIQIIDTIGRERNINVNDENTFDSDEFPKVVFENELGFNDHCDSCGGPL